ncbi:type II secretion system protein [Uliginosibacterium sp. H3]|uniref:Type II secretion system protein n=1 Tax=Uliginosibacterium silvisoli TaxID=3114758 RepID=A0ABU6K586_9RHOO|nr:type II secretion system protein [Uliginosibacterium sp. H3]
MKAAQRTSSLRTGRHRMRGFAYLFLLFALAIVGLLLASFGQNWSTTTQRQREAELLFIGKQFSQAMASYKAHSPEGTPTAPVALEDLLEDKRFPFPVRHMRQIFRDPMTGKRDWDVQIADGRVVGLRSHSQKEAIRSKLPDYVVLPSDAGDTPVYHDWMFIAAESEPAATPSSPKSNSPPTTPRPADGAQFH